MRDMFNKRQRFSLRKYSFGVASVLGSFNLLKCTGCPADETVAPTTAGMETTAEPDVVVEQSAPTASVAPATTENTPSQSLLWPWLVNNPIIAQESQATSTTSQTAASSEVA
ncbi:MAG: YSIRK-type signal peptide-containing protein [Streptococcus sp.]